MHPADVAQLVEHHLAKVRVASSNLVIRSSSQGSETVSRSLVLARYEGGSGARTKNPRFQSWRCSPSTDMRHS